MMLSSAPLASTMTGEMTENVRVTALQNGLVILNNVQLPGTTAGGADSEIAKPGPATLTRSRQFSSVSKHLGSAIAA